MRYANEVRPNEARPNEARPNEAHPNEARPNEISQDPQLQAVVPILVPLARTGAGVLLNRQKTVPPIPARVLAIRKHPFE